MANPFEDTEAMFHVLLNDEGQYSLWPQHAAVPAGWAVAFGPAAKADCLGFVVADWTDMRLVGGW